MSDIHPGTPRDDADRSPFTIEDAGSTTDAGDLVGGERARQNDAALSDDDAVASAGAESWDRSSASGDAGVPSDAEPAGDLMLGDADRRSGTASSGTADGDPDGRASVDAGSGSHVAEAPADDAARDGAVARDDGSAGHAFDETNGVVDGIQGESGGFAAGDVESSGDRAEGFAARPYEADPSEVRTDDRRSADVGSSGDRVPSRDSDADGVEATRASGVDHEYTDTAPADTVDQDDEGAAASGTGDEDGRPGLASLDDDGSIGHVFDQTNGVIDRLDGDSDGSAESDILSSGERADENPDFFHDADVRGVDVDDSRVTGN